MVEPTPAGSRVVTRVGWTGPTKWFMPVLTIVVLFAVIANSPDVPAALSGGESDTWVLGRARRTLRWQTRDATGFVRPTRTLRAHPAAAAWVAAGGGESILPLN